MGSLDRRGPASCFAVGQALSCERGPLWYALQVCSQPVHSATPNGSRLGIHLAQCFPHGSMGQDVTRYHTHTHTQRQREMQLTV